MFTTVDQVKQIIKNYLAGSGQGGFLTGTVESTAPLKIKCGQRLLIGAEHLYISDGCIGLRINGRQLRPALKKGEGVLLLCRPNAGDGTRYILLDRIQPYTANREVTLP